jgi:4-oxalocrotonate tautomerase family enzyme
VKIDMWAGADDELKRNLAKGITGVIVDNVKCPAQAVTIIFNEVPTENWVIGGRFCSEMSKEKK